MWLPPLVQKATILPSFPEVFPEHVQFYVSPLPPPPTILLQHPKDGLAVPKKNAEGSRVRVFVCVTCCGHRERVEIAQDASACVSDG